MNQITQLPDWFIKQTETITEYYNTTGHFISKHQPTSVFIKTQVPSQHVYTISHTSECKYTLPHF